jgi:hypothetical protein
MRGGALTETELSFSRDSIASGKNNGCLFLVSAKPFLLNFLFFSGTTSTFL